jgi:hypothetical protein
MAPDDQILACRWTAAPGGPHGMGLVGCFLLALGMRSGGDAGGAGHVGSRPRCPVGRLSGTGLAAMARTAARWDLRRNRAASTLARRRAQVALARFGAGPRVDGTFYGSWYRHRSKGWAAVDADTGAVRYENNTLAKGSVLYADHRLYCLCEDGEMVLLQPAPDTFNVAGRFRLTAERRHDVWAHPVILAGRLYLREQETLYCFDVKAGSQ